MSYSSQPPDELGYGHCTSRVRSIKLRFDTWKLRLSRGDITEVGGERLKGCRRLLLVENHQFDSRVLCIVTLEIGLEEI